MDAEEGVEVVWNETYFSSLKKLNEQKDKIQKVYDHLIALESANIGRFHDYWIDKDKEKPRVVFITEYMSSGTMKQFLRKTKSNKMEAVLFSNPLGLKLPPQLQSSDYSRQS